MPVVAFNKEVGETMNQCMDRYRDTHIRCKKLAYAGRLDPLASGLVFVFSNEDVKKKEECVALSKKYTFSVLEGFQTDTYDIMGLTLDPTNNGEDQVVKKMKYNVPYPAYSSQNIKPYNKPLWYCTKNNLPVENYPQQDVEVMDYRKISSEQILGKDLLELITNRIHKVTKPTFRQKEIITNWKMIIDKEKYYTISHHEIIMTKGGYVRYFGNHMGGCCFDICRTAYIYQPPFYKDWKFILLIISLICFLLLVN